MGENNFEKFGPAYAKDDSLLPQNQEELNEAKKEAGVKDAKEARNNVYKYAVETKDSLLQKNVSDKMIDEEYLNRENMISKAVANLIEHKNPEEQFQKIKESFSTLTLEDEQEILSILEKKENQEFAEKARQGLLKQLDMLEKRSVHTDIECPRYASLAEVYEKLGNTEKAKEMWQKRLESLKKEYHGDLPIPGEPSFHFPYGDFTEVYEKLGNTEKVKEIWQKRLELLKEEYHGDLPRPGKRFSYDDFVEVYEKLGDTEKVKEMLQQIILNKKDCYRESIIEAYEKLGNTEKAKEMWQEIINENVQIKNNEKEFDYERDEAHVELAKAYEKIGQTKKAREEWLEIAKNELDGKAGYAYEKAGEITKAIKSYKKQIRDCDNTMELFFSDNLHEAKYDKFPGISTSVQVLNNYLNASSSSISLYQEIDFLSKKLKIENFLKKKISEEYKA